MKEPFPDRMSDGRFRFMEFLYRLTDPFEHRALDRRVRTFGIREGMTLVDYGCGPGRYIRRFSQLVGARGKIYAVDVHELALRAVEREVAKHKLRNVQTVLARGYDCGLPAGIADMICALDMFFAVHDPSALLGELRRIARLDAILVLDDGHQARTKTKAALAASNVWEIVEESHDHLKCRPKI